MDEGLFGAPACGEQSGGHRLGVEAHRRILVLQSLHDGARLVQALVVASLIEQQVRLAKRETARVGVGAQRADRIAQTLDRMRDVAGRIQRFRGFLRQQRTLRRLARDAEGAAVVPRGVGVREQRDRVISGAFVPADGVLDVVRAPGVLGDRGDVERLLVGERLGDAGVQRARLRAQELGVDRLARERVPERKRVALVVVFLDDQLEIARAAQRRVDRNRRHAGEPRDEVRGEPAAHDGGVKQDVAIAFRERREALADGDADARRHVDAARVAVAALERAAQQLLGEERPAVGELANALQRVGRQRAIDLGERDAQEPVDVGVLQRLEHHRVFRVAFESGEHAHALRFGVRVVDAIGRDERDRFGREPSREETQELDRPAVGPVHVFEHDQQPGRVAARDLGEGRRDRCETPRLLVGFGVAAHLAFEAGIGAQGVERFDDRGVRRVRILAYRRHDGAQSVAGGRGDELCDEPRLAHAGLSAQDEKRRAALAVTACTCRQVRQLRFAPDELSAEDTR